MEKKNGFWNRFLQRYGIEGLNGMALGLFSTLIVGLIMKQIGSAIGANMLGTLFVQLGSIASVATGVGIGVGVAHTLKAPKLVIYTSAITGFVGAQASALVSGTLLINEGKTVALNGAGDPLGAFIAAIIGIEIGRRISGKTKLDIILTPILTIFAGGLAGVLVGPSLSNGMKWLGHMIGVATEIQPFLMGIIISTVMGMILTLPISSAALSIILGLSGLPAGAATIGCATQMVGFAVASFRENKWNGLLAQGLGTSMLQVPNIVRNPLIWVPPTLASAILGPLGTVVFRMQNNAAGAGMGTAGLVGPLMTWETMRSVENGASLWMKIVLLHFILPAVLTWIISEVMRKKKWIKEGDMKLEV